MKIRDVFFLLVIQNCVMSEIEHTRTLGKVHHYNNKNIGFINRSSPSAKMTPGPTTAPIIFCGFTWTSDVLLRGAKRNIDDVCMLSKPPT
ncbi:hypothetical protein GLOIN_2v153824 [Rhizophagus irregularis DAOM 181602=DAOM 197198]|uniref:Uncharacterized protein n=1 Tax=Rhizophagus irregularis (strain DAOM 181602 / DAOM 197198 / MUCL 43194) TaxID=747089 RepID=A0A2P4QU21_RHIID|nr:hypothetical protein GLOIN_2v153824 [Rhizophagus irregularis DAOM 181602=DAOM 197198]POG81141.1 hypothetical protein GLOIN_2v153824 [Rhizophagus irregularis DAOM 181602=DAOM 197198]|eukprot:XP_025188007.1 hypothetical protein GLOIN_2v153824 [Rhizophagus irregularis DAOM 181602=DAOM 197198]